jgi:hypothetical protein
LHRRLEGREGLVSHSSEKISAKRVVLELRAGCSLIRQVANARVTDVSDDHTRPLPPNTSEMPASTLGPQIDRLESALSELEEVARSRELPRDFLKALHYASEFFLRDQESFLVAADKGISRECAEQGKALAASQSALGLT